MRQSVRLYGGGISSDSAGGGGGVCIVIRSSVCRTAGGRPIDQAANLLRPHARRRPRSPCVAALSAVCFHEVLPADVWFRRAARQPADERASFDIRRRTLMTQSAAAPGVDVGGQSTCWRQPGFAVGLFEATDDVRRRDDVRLASTVFRQSPCIIIIIINIIFVYLQVVKRSVRRVCCCGRGG